MLGEVTVVPAPPGVVARTQVTVPPEPPDTVAEKVTEPPLHIVPGVAVLVAQVGSAITVTVVSAPSAKLQPDTVPVYTGR